MANRTPSRASGDNSIKKRQMSLIYQYWFCIKMRDSNSLWNSPKGLRSEAPTRGCLMPWLKEEQGINVATMTGQFNLWQLWRILCFSFIACWYLVRVGGQEFAFLFPPWKVTAARGATNAPFKLFRQPPFYYELEAWSRYHLAKYSFAVSNMVIWGVILRKWANAPISWVSKNTVKGLLVVSTEWPARRTLI